MSFPSDLHDREPLTAGPRPRERELLMPLYGAYHGRKLDPQVAAPFVARGWLTVGRRRDWLTEEGRATLRAVGFEL